MINEYHVRIIWSKINDWSGIHKAENMLEAAREAIKSVAELSGQSEIWIDLNAQVSVHRFYFES